MIISMRLHATREEVETSGRVEEFGYKVHSIAVRAGRDRRGGIRGRDGLPGSLSDARCGEAVRISAPYKFAAGVHATKTEIKVRGATIGGDEFVSWPVLVRWRANARF